MTEETLDDLLTRLEALAREATPGPWRMLTSDVCDRAIESENGRILAWATSECLGREQDLKNGNYLAALDPTTVLRLIGELRRNRA